VRYRLDASARRIDAGRTLLAGSPLKLVRLTEAGARWLDRADAGDDVAPNALLDRLVDSGTLHPAPAPGSGPFTSQDVSVVIPTRGGDVHALVRSLHERVAAVIVVDDASSVPIAPIEGARVVRREHRGGPGAARMTGLDLVTTALVAFVDDDVEPADGWLDLLLAHFADPRVALVAPRVTSGAARGPTGDGSEPMDEPSGSRPRVEQALAAYERVRSPLDLGPVEGPVRAGTRLSYVPAAALVCRVAAVRELGGFDPALRTGEDVDLVWRLDERGWRCRYEPTAVVEHRPRATRSALVAQRVAYGRSAASLAVRHPGSLAPVRVSGWSAAVWALAVGGAPVASLAVAAGTAVALGRKLRVLPTSEVVRLVGLGHLFAGRQLANALTRAWWPFAVAAALVSRRARRALLLAVVVPAALDWRRTRPDIDPARYLALRALDDAAYGAGVVQGAWHEQTMAPLVPDLTSWPRSSKAERPVRPRARSAAD
jgi:GT2 family glycosyltransferase